MDDKEKIVLLAREKFMKEGFYKTSMDELAKDLSMSKKTIYKYYDSKEKLIEAVFEELMSTVSKKMDAIIKGNDNTVTKIRAILELLGSLSMNMGEKWLSDMKLHAPHLWEKIEGFRTQKLNSNFKLIFEQGKKEGTIEDKPIDIILKIFVAAVRAVITPDFLVNSKYSFRDAVEVTFDILFNGILTEKGSKQFYNLKNRIRQ